MTLLSLMLINLSAITGVKGTVDFSIEKNINYQNNSLVSGLSNKDNTTIYNFYGENINI